MVTRAKSVSVFNQLAARSPTVMGCVVPAAWAHGHGNVGLEPRRGAGRRREVSSAQRCVVIHTN